MINENVFCHFCIVRIFFYMCIGLCWKTPRSVGEKKTEKLGKAKRQAYEDIYDVHYGK